MYCLESNCILKDSFTHSQSYVRYLLSENTCVPTVEQFRVVFLIIAKMQTLFCIRYGDLGLKCF